MRFPVDRVIRLKGCCVSTGGDCSSEEAARVYANTIEHDLSVRSVTS